MTPREAACLRVITERLRIDGVAPSFDEMAKALGICKSSVHRLVTSLERQGRIHRERYRHHAISIPSSSDRITEPSARRLTERAMTLVRNRMEDCKRAGRPFGVANVEQAVFEALAGASL